MPRNNHWLDELATQCQRTSQKRVADKLQVSAALINQVLKGKYPGDLGRIQQLVEGAFMQSCVDCPVIGEITKDKCLFHQSRPFAATNPQRLMLHKACRSGCPHSQLEQTIAGQIKVKQITPVEAAPAPPIVAEFYGYKEVIERLRQQAGSADELNQLLADELEQLAAKYNRLLQAKEEVSA